MLARRCKVANPCIFPGIDGALLRITSSRSRAQEYFSIAIRSASVLCALVCAASAALAQEALGWNVGDRWKFKQVDLWNGRQVATLDRSVSAVSAGDFLTHVEWGGSIYDETVRADGSQYRDANGARIDYIQVKLPIDVGRKWTSTITAQGSSGRFYREFKCEVKREEKVSVPAGDFEAFFIDCDGFWSGNHEQGRAVMSMWFAPQAKWIVKWREKTMLPSAVGTSQYEFLLTEYQVAP